MKNPFIIKTLDKDFRVKTKKTLDFEESFLDSNSEDAQGIETPINQKKIFLLGALIVLALSFLAARTFYLQIIKGKEYRKLAEGNRIFLKIIMSPRGIVYDRNGKTLLKNVPGLDVIAMPSNLPQNGESFEKEIDILAKVLEENKEKLKNILEIPTGLMFTPILVKENISHDTLLALENYKEDLPGIEIQNRPRREYLEGAALSHILGYAGPLTKEEWEKLGKSCKKGNCYLLSDIIGKAGVEASYEKELRGKHGEERFEINSRGEIQKSLGTKEYITGNNLFLNIDLEFQKKVVEVISENIGNKKVAAVVAMNPQNGAVLALYSHPSYDNNLFGRGISEQDYRLLIDNPQKPLFNRVIAGVYSPGSTIKPLMAAAALNEGVADINTVVNSTGGIQVGRWFFKDWKDGGHGPTNVIKAISESVNSYFYTIIGGTAEKEGLGIEKTTKYLKLFGFMKKTGIDIPGEGEGFVPNPLWKNRVKKEKWYIGDTYNLAIGQGDLLVTPIQVAAYVSAIANGGILYQPRLLSQIISPDNKITTYKNPVILENNLARKEVIDIIRRGMRESVISGAASGINDLSVRVAGKTGTAEIGKENKYNSWFSSFAPYENPEITLVVLVEEGEGGNKDALPIAKEILKWYFDEYKKKQ